MTPFKWVWVYGWILIGLCLLQYIIGIANERYRREIKVLLMEIDTKILIHKAQLSLLQLIQQQNQQEEKQNGK